MIIIILNLLERGLKLIKEYGVVKFVGGAILLAMISIFFYFVFNPTKGFELYDEWKDRQHDYLMEMRMDNAPKVQSLIDKLTFKVDASRVLLLELHNGNTSVGGIPFTKCSATFEGLNIGAHPVANQYQNQNLSLIPFVSHLFDCGYWCGNTDQLLEIDRALYYKMKSNNTEHFAACVIEGVDKPLAMLIISFDKLPNGEHDCELVRNNIRHIAMELAVLMEVERRIGKNKLF
jgi:hypothetical protein